MDVEKLKQKILDLAIRGKLVPQDPNDEPASVLIEKIKAEKEKLVKEGKIKASKEESYIYKGSDNFYYEKIGNNVKNIQNEIPFDIPDNWAWVRLSAICDYGKNITANDKDIQIGSWVLDLEDIESYTSQLLNKKYRKKDEKIGSAKHRFNKGDLLFSKLRIYLKKVIIADEDGFCTSEIMPLNFNGFCIHNYARYYFISSFFLKKVETMQYGCKMPRLGTNDAKQLLFPLPPLSEQERICEKVELILNRIKQISIDTTNISFYAESIKHKILESIFGDNSSYKSYYQLNDIFEFQNGYAFSSDTYSQIGTPVVRISDLTDGVVSLDSCVKTNQINIDEKFVVHSGDLLIAMSGATTGKMGVFIGKEKCYLNQRVGNIKIKRKDLIIDGYRNYLFMYLKKDILKAAYGGAQPNISGQKILSMNIYLPSLEIQKQQVDLINAAFKYLDSIIY